MLGGVIVGCHNHSLLGRRPTLTATTQSLFTHSSVTIRSLISAHNSPLSLPPPVRLRSSPHMRRPSIMHRAIQPPSWRPRFWLPKREPVLLRRGCRIASVGNDPVPDPPVPGTTCSILRGSRQDPVPLAPVLLRGWVEAFMIGDHSVPDPPALLLRAPVRRRVRDDPVPDAPLIRRCYWCYVGLGPQHRSR